MSAGIVALFFALGCSGWVFSKLQNRTGYGNSGAAIKGAAITFAAAFIVMFTLAHMFLH